MAEYSEHTANFPSPDAHLDTAWANMFGADPPTEWGGNIGHGLAALEPQQRLALWKIANGIITSNNGDATSAVLEAVLRAHSMLQSLRTEETDARIAFAREWDALLQSADAAGDNPNLGDTQQAAEPWMLPPQSPNGGDDGDEGQLPLAG